AVLGPGVGTEPLVPQNRTSIQQDGGSEAMTSQEIAGKQGLRRRLCVPNERTVSAASRPGSPRFSRSKRGTLRYTRVAFWLSHRGDLPSHAFQKRDSRAVRSQGRRLTQRNISSGASGSAFPSDDQEA